MRRYLAYLGYVIRHRWFVMLECFRYRLIWRGLVHDLSKFLPSEFIPYARFFHNPDGSKRQVRDKTGYYKPDDTGDAAFDRAWYLHQHRNSHHWQHHVLALSEGGTKPFPMPAHDVAEMVCDWHGAARAQGVKDSPGDRLSVQSWWEKNQGRIHVHPDTFQDIEFMLRNREEP